MQNEPTEKESSLPFTATGWVALCRTQSAEFSDSLPEESRKQLVEHYLCSTAQGPLDSDFHSVGANSLEDFV